MNEKILDINMIRYSMSSKPLTEAHRHIITKNRVHLIRSLIVNHEFLNFFLEDYTLTAEIVDEIQVKCFLVYYDSILDTDNLKIKTF